MLNNLDVAYHRRTVDIAEAVEVATTPEYSSGTLEAMRDKAALQDKIIARMLCVQFNQYDDHFTEDEYCPKTDAEKLAFILGGDFKVTER